MALEQHAIPTQVTSYEFRIVGDMTLKQFAWLASGIITAIIIYSLPLPDIFRWPIIVLVAPSGAIVAFVPIEGRGIDRWIIAFVKAIYSPTEFIWRQENPIPEFFKKSRYVQQSLGPSKVSASDQTKLEEYIHTLPAVQSAGMLEKQEEMQLQNIDNLLASMKNDQLPSPNSSPNQPVSQPYFSLPLDDAHPQDLSSVPVVIPDSDPSSLSNPDSSLKREHPRSMNLQALEKQIADNLQVNAQTDPQPHPAPPPPPQYESSAPTPPSGDASVTPDKSMESDLQDIMAKPNQPQSPDEDEPAIPVLATFSDQLPINSPTTPNLVVGMVTDVQDKIVDNAIIEITDQNHKPVRALKTNQLGQFSIATPLKDGTYYLEIDKPPLQFDHLQFQAQGKPLLPIKIKAK